MVGVILGLFAGWKKWAAIGGVIAALVLYVGWLKWDIAEYRAQVAQLETREAVRVAEANKLALEMVQAEKARAEKAMASVVAKARASERRVAALTKEIERVPQSEDCAIGPGAQRVLDRLFNRAPDLDGDEGGPRGSSPVAPRGPKPAR